MSVLNFTLLQAGSSGIGAFLPLILVAVVFYFFMIRPQMRKSKKQKEFRGALKKGDKIVTIGGIHAKIKEMNDTTAMIETEGGARMRIEKNAISMEFSSGKADEAVQAIEQNK